ncbi:ABC transporter ATP-binding protein [Ureaplasma ceti]|uniref:ABC transporter ATP-binding protein n=1 Tax=Ureaplasma ceti TaxID=3119530 RepID=A0ABP9UB25_9BACT
MRNILTDKNFITDEEKKIDNDTLLSVKNLSVSFKTKAGTLRAVRGIDLEIKRGSIVGLVGESGSGKSVMLKSIIGFNDGSTTTADLFNLENIDLTTIKRKQWVYIRGTKVAYIPQDPLMSLNPTKTIASQILEAIKVSEYRSLQWKLFELQKAKTPNYRAEMQQAKAEYKHNVKKDVMYKRMIDLLNFIGIVNPEQKVKAYPHEFSGGMRQRIAIAMAVAVKPDLIIADEPTTALDVIIQAKVLELIKKLRDNLNISIIFISHNIALVANFCDYINVVYAGKIIEKGTTKDIFTCPAHPYTWALISSIPDPSSKDELVSISGTPPNMLFPPKGDAFAPRNKYALKIDFQLEPPMFKISDTHYAATWLLSPDAERIPIPNEVRQKAAIALASIEKKQRPQSTNKSSQSDKHTDDSENKETEGADN